MYMRTGYTLGGGSPGDDSIGIVSYTSIVKVDPLRPPPLAGA